MLSIQDLGLSILGDSPKNFYILGGIEYGIKDKYIEILESKIGPRLEYPNVMDVVNLMSKFQIIPIPPQVYVVRYDKSFVSTATKELATKILNLDILGALVLVYEDDKDLAKLDKLFPDNTASVDKIDVKHMVKYLRADFPDLDKKTIESAAVRATNYYHAKNICRCLDAVKDKMLLTEGQMVSLFDIQPNYSNEAVQEAVASRNFNDLTYMIDHYDGDPQGILYQILRVMVELDKCFDGKYVNSPLKKYTKQWTRLDVYFMFNHTYEAIKELRSGYTVEIPDLLLYLSAMLSFKQVPDLRRFKWGSV